MIKLNLLDLIKNIFFFFKKKFKNSIYFITKYGIIEFVFHKLIRKAFNFLNFVFFFPVALLITIVIRLISPIILIRFIKLRSNRLGHFVIETELYLCEKFLNIDKPKVKYLDFFFQEDNIVANKYIKKIIKKKIILINSHLGRIIQALNKFFSGDLNKYEAKIINNQDDVNNVFEKINIQLKIPENDYEKYKKDFNKIKLPINSKFVCVVFRDSNYLNKNLKFNDWSYHDYRDTDIDTFDYAAEYLISKGYYVVRVGRDVQKKMNYENEKFIDYSSSNFCSDHMDALLASKCRFFITTGTGAEAFAYIFRKPLLFVNFTSIGLFRTFHEKHLHIFKNFYSKNLKRNLNLKEIFDLNLAFEGDKKNYDKKEIVLIENSRAEIRDAVIEMDTFLENNLILNKKDNELQNLFWKKYEELLIKTKMRHKHGVKFQAKISNKFLKENSYLID